MTASVYGFMVPLNCTLNRIETGTAIFQPLNSIGRCSGLMVSMLNFGLNGLVRALAGALRYVLGQDTYSHMHSASFHPGV